MNRFVLIAVVAAWAGAGTAAIAQSGMATGPTDGTTGPTVPPPSSDTRRVDQSIATVPPSSASPTSSAPAGQPDNWRSSSGLNADPANPSGAPGPGVGLGTSPSR
jgi:hypothetical protein